MHNKKTFNLENEDKIDVEQRSQLYKSMKNIKI